MFVVIPSEAVLRPTRDLQFPALAKIRCRSLELRPAPPKTRGK